MSLFACREMIKAHRSGRRINVFVREQEIRAFKGHFLLASILFSIDNTIKEVLCKVEIISRLDVYNVYILLS